MVNAPYSEGLLQRVRTTGLVSPLIRGCELSLKGMAVVINTLSHPPKDKHTLCDQPPNSTLQMRPVCPAAPPVPVLPSAVANCTVAPPDPTNGAFSCSLPARQGAQCIATCRLGYVGNPTPSTTCSEGGAWTTPTGMCVQGWCSHADICWM